MPDLQDLTGWFDPKVKPVRLGEYNASQFQNQDTLRWWNGTTWSCMYFGKEPDAYKDKARGLVEMAKLQDLIYWRGLRYDPEQGEKT